MAQADLISTATGEGVSRGGSTKSTSLRSGHTEPAAALAGNPTHLIESEDLEHFPLILIHNLRVARN